MFVPQQATVLLLLSAQVWSSFAETAVALVRPKTATGTFELLVVPLPSCPLVFWPQHFAEPPESRAHEWPPPAEMELTEARPLTATGVFELVFAASPS